MLCYSCYQPVVKLASYNSYPLCQDHFEVLQRQSVMMLAVVESREKKIVDLRRWSATSPTGIYYCDIATVAVHDNETTQLRVYVGLYTNGGGLQ